jgi:hypothetical protein
VAGMVVVVDTDMAGGADTGAGEVMAAGDIGTAVDIGAVADGGMVAGAGMVVAGMVAAHVFLGWRRMGLLLTLFVDV